MGQGLGVAGAVPENTRSLGSHGEQGSGHGMVSIWLFITQQRTPAGPACHESGFGEQVGFPCMRLAVQRQETVPEKSPHRWRGTGVGGTDAKAFQNLLPWPWLVFPR